MPDMLTKLYNEKVTDTMDSHQVFQAGLTAGAVSMRNRSLNAIDPSKTKDQNFVNEVRNKIGQLSDIPTE